MKKTEKQTSMFDFFNRKKQQSEEKQGTSKETKPKSEEKEISQLDNHEKNYKGNRDKKLNKSLENRKSKETETDTVKTCSPRKRASENEEHKDVKKNKVESDHREKHNHNESGKKLGNKTGHQLKYKKLKVINKFLQEEECESKDKEIETSNVEPTPPSPNKSKKHSPSHPKNERMFLMQSAESRKKLIKQKFLVEMPEDFYSFFSLCEKLNKSDPLAAFSELDVYLAGPYDVLAGRKFNSEDQSEYLRHWRFYYDPPEFQTVIRVDNEDQFHMGYYRDDPKEMPCFVASNCASKGCKLIPMTSNIFAALHTYLSSLLKEGHYPTKKDVINRYLRDIEKWAQPNGYKLNTFIPGMNTRKRKIVARTFHGVGIVVPVDKKMDLGYRPLIVSEEKLKRLLRNISRSKTDEERDHHISELQPVITAAMIAVDECDFGTALELGINMFCYGGDVFHPMILQSLTTAYTLLQRTEFIQIIEAHLQNRKRANPRSEILPKYASPSKKDRLIQSPRKYDMFVNEASRSEHESNKNRDMNKAVSGEGGGPIKDCVDKNKCSDEENSPGKKPEVSKDTEEDSDTSVNTQNYDYDSQNNKTVNKAHTISESDDSEN